MNGAKIENGICTNVAVFASENSIQQFGFIPCPDGYGIGDIYDVAAGWSKAPVQEAIRTAADIIADIKAAETAQQRSQAAILAAQLAGETPADADVEYFTQYENEKAALRAELANIDSQTNSSGGGTNP